MLSGMHTRLSQRSSSPRMAGLLIQGTEAIAVERRGPTSHSCVHQIGSGQQCSRTTIQGMLSTTATALIKAEYLLL
ncbi:hypothetical protein CYMTET_38833 [Cymbomonas tetramitiformis]|uniref:Uncharacterized protein n=1 Tax=Cymbomonas tetramitiformis TaxID=36881 RepID=A0AAE0CCZ8_9CHLO|nr:hypothetical protein CYMTET_38833 [Cymbomonas tetramitiformis]